MLLFNYNTLLYWRWCSLSLCLLNWMVIIGLVISPMLATTTRLRHADCILFRHSIAQCINHSVTTTTEIDYFQWRIYTSERNENKMKQKKKKDQNSQSPSISLPMFCSHNSSPYVMKTQATGSWLCLIFESNVAYSVNYPPSQMLHMIYALQLEMRSNICNTNYFRSAQYRRWAGKC